MSRSLYDTLGVGRQASEQEITRAYRKLAKTCHPDLHPGDKTAEDKFRRITAAYDVLRDKTSRARYDRGEIDEEGRERGPAGGYWQQRGAGPYGAGAGHYRAGAGPQGGFAGMDDVLSDLFGFGGRGRARRGAGFAMPGEDVRLTLELDLAAAVKGGVRRVAMHDGTLLDVNIPPGTEDGQVLRLRGKGRPGHGGAAGDALVEIKVAEHPLFRRKGLDIHADVPVPLATAVMGGKLHVPTLDGQVSVKVPRHASSGKILRLRGKGVHDARSKRHGDLLVRLMVELPDPASEPDLMAALEQWAQRQKAPAA
ncbi:DnaJ C-terminal domain-containing protein [Geminicoccaceae bacterium 1502E]|nr:DnaJ C-terminal domain-containing protein [Geminicoccaceae bacterium 1502E]